MAIDVQFWYTTSQKLEGLSVQEGRIIALSDKPGYFYDMGGRRYRVNNIEYVNELPSAQELAQLKSAIENNNQVDSLGVLDLLYVTPDGVFSYNGSTVVEEAGFNTLLPVDVKEAPKDGFVYSRQGTEGQKSSWTRLRWIFASDSDIPVSDINARIESLLTYGSASIKIAGRLNMSSNLVAKIEDANKLLYIDLRDTDFSNDLTINITCVYDSSVTISGNIGCAVSISGDGQVSVQDAKLSGNIVAKGFSGTLNIHNCEAKGKTIRYTDPGEGSNRGRCLITGCNFIQGTVELPSEQLCTSLVQGNLFDSTEVTRGGRTIDVFYNNEGGIVQ